MKKLVYILFFLSVYSCSFFDSSDEIPMYLEVEQVVFNTKIGEGSNSSNITNISVFADGFNIGVFPYPSKIPILDLDKNGKIELDIFAGVRNNGQGSNQIAYPFYKPLKFNLDFEENLVLPMDLEFEYMENIDFIYNDDFENNLMFDHSGSETITDFIKSGDAIYGDFCGLIETTEDESIFEEESSFRRTKEDIENSVVYLELDYKNTIPFQIGFISYAGNLGIRNYKLAITESLEWNKVYIELTQELNVEDYDQFAILIGSTSVNDIGKIWIDNVKLLRLTP